MIELSYIDPVVFEVKWYGFSYILGIFFGVMYGNHIIKNSLMHRIKPETLDNFISWAIAGIVLGGRIGYIVLYDFSSYLQKPLDVPKIWQGGMSFHGGLIGIFIVCFFYCRKIKVSIAAFGDILAIIAPIGIFFGRLANFVNMEHLGCPTMLPWACKYYGDAVFRHPSQIYEALLQGGLLFSILALVNKFSNLRKSCKGSFIAIFLIGYGVIRIFTELFRTPDKLFLFFNIPITIGQLLSFITLITGLTIASLIRGKHK